MYANQNDGTKYLVPNFEGIPSELKNLKQWVLWKAQPNPKPDGKPLKVPYQVLSGKGASVTNPDHWSTFEQAQAKYEHSNGYYSGIGFVFTDADPYCGADFDNCVHNDTVEQWAADLIAILDSYTEPSVSETGRHTIIKARKPQGNCKKEWIGSDGLKRGIEIYDAGRYFCFTGRGKGTIEPRQNELTQVYDYVFTAINENTDATSNNWQPESVHSATIMSLQCANNAKVLIDSQVSKVHDATPETRHDTLRNAAITLGGLLSASWSECTGLRSTFENLLMVAAQHCFGSEYASRKSEVARTIKDGLDYGLAKPLPDRTNAPTRPPATLYPIPSDADVKAACAKALAADNPCEEFDYTILPEPLVDWIDQCNAISPVPTLIAVQCVLTGISAIMGTTVYMDYFQKDGFFPNLWMLSLMETGGGKTTTMNRGTSFVADHDEPIFNRRIEAKKELEALMEAEPMGKKETQEAEKALKAEIEELKRQQVTMINSWSKEVFFERLAGNGKLVIASEYNDFLEQLEVSYNRGLASQLLDYYDVPARRERETKGGGSTILEYPFLSINAVSTVTNIQDHLNEKKINTGWWTRYLIIKPYYVRKCPPALPPKGVPNPDSSAILAILENVNSYGHKGIKCEFTPDAERIYRQAHEQLDATVVAYKNELMTRFLTRWSPDIVKIAMVLHPFQPNAVLGLIDPDSVIAATAIVWEAVKSTLWLVREQLNPSETEQGIKAVTRWLATRNGSATYAEITASNCTRGLNLKYKSLLSDMRDRKLIVFNGDLWDKSLKVGDVVITLV